MRKDTTGVGIAGEYLVMADIFAQGYSCVRGHEGASYDLLLFLPKKILKLQVKTCKQPTKSEQRPVYHWRYITSKGRVKHKREEYTLEDFDYFAFVGLSEKVIAYVPFTEDLASNAYYKVRGEDYSTARVSYPYLDEFPLDTLLRREAVCPVVKLL